MEMLLASEGGECVIQCNGSVIVMPTLLLIGDEEKEECYSGIFTPDTFATV